MSSGGTQRSPRQRSTFTKSDYRSLLEASQGTIEPERISVAASIIGQMSDDRNPWVEEGEEVVACLDGHAGSKWMLSFQVEDRKFSTGQRLTGRVWECPPHQCDRAVGCLKLCEAAALKWVDSVMKRKGIKWFPSTLKGDELQGNRTFGVDIQLEGERRPMGQTYDDSTSVPNECEFRE